MSSEKGMPRYLERAVEESRWCAMEVRRGEGGGRGGGGRYVLVEAAAGRQEQLPLPEVPLSMVVEGTGVSPSASHAWFRQTQRARDSARPLTLPATLAHLRALSLTFPLPATNTPTRSPCP
jgi:hypothetical protein